MRKSVLGAVIAAVALLAIIGLVMANRADVPVPPTQQQTVTPSSPSNQDNTANDSTTERPASPSPSPTTANSASVEIADFAFSPSTITVKKGTTVKWTNKDSTAHTVTPDQQSADFTGSELLAQNETYSFTFNKAGTYSYHCQPHPNMKGTVVVTE